MGILLSVLSHSHLVQMLRALTRESPVVGSYSIRAPVAVRTFAGLNAGYHSKPLRPDCPGYVFPLGPLAAAAQARVEDVSQGVSEEVVSEHGKAQGDAGANHKPGGREEVFAVAAREGDAPGRRARLDTVAKEGERSLDQDDGANDRTEGDDDVGQHVGQDVAPENARRRGAE